MEPEAGENQLEGAVRYQSTTTQVELEVPGPGDVPMVSEKR